MDPTVMRPLICPQKTPNFRLADDAGDSPIDHCHESIATARLSKGDYTPMLTPMGGVSRGKSALVYCLSSSSGTLTERRRVSSDWIPAGRILTSAIGQIAYHPEMCGSQRRICQATPE